VRRLAAIALALAGCAAGSGAPPPPDGPGNMLLGTIGASAEWVALTDGQDATLVEGAQGGFHVWMKVRVDGVAPGELGFVREAHRLSDNVPVLRPPPGTLTVGEPGPDGWWEQPMPMPMFMCPSPIGISVIDTPIVFTIDLRDGNSDVAGASITLVPRCPADAVAFCQKICTG
jgi:hypothetical protein